MIAFSGKGGVSEVIKTITRSGVSHVAAVLKTQPNGKTRVQVIESTSLNGFIGVSISFLSQRLNNYEGEVWWFPLNAVSRDRLNAEAYYDWLLKQHNKPYDYSQAIKAGLDALNDFCGSTYAQEDFNKLFCSELMAGALEVGGVVGELNASEVLPIDMCRFNLWGMNYYQIKGEPRKINGVGSMIPDNFGV
jgi:hypothetical protein